MAAPTMDIEIKERDVFADFQVRVQIKRDWRVRLGLIFLKIGVWLTGCQFVEEFPMSVIQDDQPVEMES